MKFKLKLWQWLVALAVLVLLILAGIALGRHWRSNRLIDQAKVNQQSIQSPQNTQVPVSPPPVELK